MKYIIFLGIFLMVGCQDGGHKRKKIGGFIVEANFINDSVMNGEVRFLTLDGKLDSKANFKDGERNGSAVTYYNNGEIKDSMYYSDNLLNGTAYKFDSNGVIEFERTNYYGLNVGDNFLYQNGKVYEYFFNNFEKKELVNCKYDSIGSCKYFFFNADPKITTVFRSLNDSVINFFLYFPHPPDFAVNYEMGLINDQNRKRDERLINNNRIFLDTLISFSDDGWKHYVSIDYRSISNDSLINVLFQKF